MNRLICLILSLFAVYSIANAQYGGFNVNILNTMPIAPISTKTPAPKKKAGDYSKKILHSGTYTIDAIGQTSFEEVQGVESTGNKVKIYNDHIEFNGKILDPEKYYGEWTWYKLYPLVYIAVGPYYQLQEVTVSPMGSDYNMYREMYEEDDED